MPVRFVCPECQSLLGVSTRKIGKQMNCPRCQTAITIPNEEQAAASLAMARSLRSEPEDEGPGEVVIYHQEPAVGLDASRRESDAWLPPAEDGSQLLVPRWVIYAQAVLMAVLALAGFAAGFLIGRAGKAPSPETDGSQARGPVTVQVQLTYEGSDGERHPDAGAVVMILPADSRPGEKFIGATLHPQAPEPLADSREILALETMGGVYARMGDSGELRLRLPQGGNHFVLMVSKNRPRQGQPAGDDLAALGRYFDSPDILGDRQYSWRLEELTDLRTLRRHFGP